MPDPFRPAGPTFALLLALAAAGRAASPELWTVATQSYSVDVPVRFSPVQSPGAVPYKSAGTADKLFGDTNGAGRVSVRISVHAGPRDVRDEAVLRTWGTQSDFHTPLTLTPPGDFAAARVPGAGRAFRRTLYYEGVATNGTRFRGIDVDVFAFDNDRDDAFWFTATASGPADAIVLTDVATLRAFLDRVADTFTLRPKPGAVIAVAGPAPALPPPRWVTATQPADADGAATPLEARVRLSRATATGDFDAFRNLVRYGPESRLDRASDTAALNTGRLASALAGRPLPGISRGASGRAIDELNGLDRTITDLTFYSNNAAKNGGLGSRDVVHIGGRYFVRRDGFRPTTRQAKTFLDQAVTNAIALGEAAELHRLGRFPNAEALDAYVDRRRKELDAAVGRGETLPMPAP